MLLVWVTSGGPAVYGKTTFSGHMLQHMLLMVGVPPLAALGAPVLLALRTLRARADASSGPREWLLRAARSRASHLMTRPAVAGLPFSGSLVGFYYTDLFELALRTHPGHVLMMVHFLASGYLFAWVIIGGSTRRGDRPPNRCGCC